MGGSAFVAFCFVCLSADVNFLCSTSKLHCLIIFSHSMTHFEPKFSIRQIKKELIFQRL